VCDDAGLHLKESPVLFTMFMMDKPKHQALRQQVRPEHRAYLAQAAHRMAFAGPLTSDDSQDMIGSLLVMDFESREAAQAWLAQEPFMKAGLFASVSIHAFANLWPQQAGFPPA
jgi:uncharacterized protein YciI